MVDFATKGDVSGIKETLQMIAEEAEKTGMKPRVTAECRNDLGQSLLSIAAQRDDEPLAFPVDALQRVRQRPVGPG